jgi:PilZ domain
MSPKLASSNSDRADREETARAQVRSDRRVHTRHPADELPWVDTVRLKYGPTVSLVDLSAGGVQVQLEDHWLRPNSSVVVEIVGGAKVFAVPSRVVRCDVIGVAPTVRYRGALEFKRLLELPDLSTHVTATPWDANPLRAHARLAAALRRLDSLVPRDQKVVDPAQAAGDVPMTMLGAGAMAAALATLDTPASRRAGAPFARELSRLFSEVAQGVEQRESPQDLIARMEQRLGRVIAAHSIRVTDGSLAERPRQGSDVVYFDAQATNGLPARKILVEFASGVAPQEWEFQLLKASGHLVALIDELEQRRRSAGDGGTMRPPVEAQASSNKLVVRFADGRLLKGYCQDFHPPRGHFHLCPWPVVAADSRVLVPIAHLKAVFFVRDFEGNAEYQEDRTTVRSGHGRKVAVTFLDDELLVGMTLNYRPDATGFFVTPCDPNGNNLRIFVSNQAIRHVRFL